MDFSKWSYGDFADAFIFYSRGNSEDLNKLLTKLTGLDYESMDLDESTRAKHEVIQAMNTFVKELDVTDVDVDFKRGKWNDKKYRQFSAALDIRSIPEVERLIREVARLDGVDPESTTPLNARQGCLMVRAIKERYQNMLLGKS